MNVNRYMAGMLLLCFSVFLGHNLVPHHHHSGVFPNPITSACPHEHGDHQGHDHDSDADTKADQHPIHCHAFNDVVFEKTSVAIYNPGSIQVLAMLVTEQALVQEEPPRSATASSSTR